MNKPPYNVPSMKEIEAIPHNGYNVVSTFSGAGGSCLGYRMAGYRVLWANEFVKAAQEVYKANHPDSILNTSDIREITGDDIRAAIGDIEIDILDGSPPCAAFSTAGKGSKGWGQVKDYSDTKQRVDDLFFEYARILRDLQPRVFVAENVSGLVKGKAKGYFKLILQELKDCGYEVKASLLNAMWLGVPQARERLIFVGVRQDVIDKIGTGISFHPTPLPYFYTVGDAWSNELPIEQAPSLDGYKVGTLWRQIEPGQHHSRRFSLFKISRGKPCATIQQRMANANGSPFMGASCTHDIECRYLTIPELKRICAFPDDFILPGTYAQQWERLGRAVPPVMMQAIAANIQEQILCKIT